MDFTLQEKAKLIEFFEFLLNNEIDKPLGEMNSEAVDSYIKILLFLQGKNIELSSEFIDEQVRKIFHEEEKATVIPDTEKTKKNYFNKKKVWLVAACIAILVALFSVISFSSERSVKDILVEFFGSFEFVPVGEEVVEDNYSYGKGNTKLIYSSAADFVKSEKIDILCPTENIADIKHISISDKNKITLAFKNADLYMTITLNSNIPPKTMGICNKKITLNGFDYYLCVMDDINKTQAYFVYSNNLYTVTNTTEKTLVEILKNMEEIKYEE